MQIMVGAVSDKGNIKETNQDNFFVKIYGDDDKDVGIFVMCDGMGGLSQGEIASSMVVRAYREWFSKEFKIICKRCNDELILNELCNVMNKANKDIIEYSQKITKKVGTTCSVLLLFNGKYYIVHIGDSRIYRIRKKIEQLTEDHSFVAMSVKNKTMTKEEARVNPRRNLLTQCIGVKENIDIFKRCGKIDGSEVYILCSDGLYNKVTDKEFEDIVKNEENLNNDGLQNCAQTLVQRVKEQGERDNITAVFVGLLSKEQGFMSKVNSWFEKINFSK